MRAAMIGGGKLGLPVSCAMTKMGHVIGLYDIVPEKRELFKQGKCDYYEPDMEEILQWSLENELTICDTVYDAIKFAEIIFIAVPTPSNDDDSFDTSYVKDAVREIAKTIEKQWLGYRVISIISTVLPGTVRNEFLPILKEELGDLEYGLCYNAQFIAMGTTIHDMLNPEFVLIGEYDERSGDVLGSFYSQLVDAPLLRMSIESAETVKMAYNCLLGFKIVYGNTLMEMCDKIEHANCDDVSHAIGIANKRLMSPRYLRGGMGDGGNCHGRDNNALSWLANQLDLSVDPFGYIMKCREEQSRHLAQIVREACDNYNLPLAILGLTFKPETNLTDYSPSILLYEHLLELYVQSAYTHDPIIKPEPLPICPKIYVLTVLHEEYLSYPFEPNSIIIDPWRMLDNPPEDCIYRPIGK